MISSLYSRSNLPLRRSEAALFYSTGYRNTWTVVQQACRQGVDGVHVQNHIQSRRMVHQSTLNIMKIFLSLDSGRTIRFAVLNQNFPLDTGRTIRFAVLMNSDRLAMKFPYMLNLAFGRLFEKLFIWSRLNCREPGCWFCAVSLFGSTLPE